MPFWSSRTVPARTAGFVLLSMALLSASSASAGELILRDGPPPGTAITPARTAAETRERVRVDASVLAAAPDSLWLELVPGEGRRALGVEIERRSAGDLVWRGRFADDDPEFISVTLTLHGGDVVGTVETPAGPTYRLLPSREGGWELRTGEGPDLGCGVGRAGAADLGASQREPVPRDEPPPGSLAAPERSAATAVRRVTMLVIFTPKAVDQLGRRRYDSLARHNVDLLNTAFRNSGIDGDARLAAVAVVDLGITHLDASDALHVLLADPRIHQLQVRWQADLVSAVLTEREASGVCGIARVLTKGNYGPGFADQAYNIVVDDCFENGRTFIHEAGHNFGAMHDPDNAPPPSYLVNPFAYGHGVDGHFYTVMAYRTACVDCGLVSVFSNPLRRVGGVPTGIHNRRDNALHINRTFPFIAQLRASEPPPPAAPSDLSATVLSPLEVALSWTDNASDETGFQIEGLAGDGTTGWVLVADLPADTEEHTVGGLQPATAYRFRVRATGAGKPSAYSNEAAATTLPPAPVDLSAEPLSGSAVRLRWTAVDGATGYEMELRAADPAADLGAAPIAHSPDGTAVAGLAAETPYTFRVRAVNGSGPSPWSEEASATTSGPGGPCVADGSTLCLLGGRFSVRAAWRNPRPPFGHGAGMARAAPGSERTGVFSFFNPDNVELVVKMLDGRAANGAFWSFYGALSDVEYWVSVRDTETAGAVRTYHNEPFALCGRGDTTAFVEEPVGAEVAVLPGAAVLPAAEMPPSPTHAADGTGACTPDSEALCLAGGRFRIEVEWANPRNEQQGKGHVFAGLGNDVTGHLWFFRPDNLELAVKVLDGRALNGHFWIFWGGLSDVAYTLHVTDTESGAEHEFVNDPYTLCGGAVTNRL